LIASRDAEDPTVEADVLGHANISTTSRYLKASRAGVTSYVQHLETPRAQQKKAAAKAAKTFSGKSSRRIRTPFAHGAPEGRAADASSAGKNRSKSLN